MTQKIVILSKPTPGDARFYERWQEVGELIRIGDCAEATVLVTDHRNPVTEETLRQMPRLKYVVSPNTGHTHLRFDSERAKITMITLRGETIFLGEVKSVAEFCMGLILRLARPFDGRIGMTLNNKILGIVGLGRIGKQLSILGSSFGMKTVHVDKESPEWSWKALFQRSDFVSLHLPEDESTLGKIDVDLLSAMRPTSYLINTARPSILDEMCLARLLVEKRIAGAALDVSDVDWGLFPQVIRTPHIAGYTVEDRVKTDEFVLEKLKQAIGPRRVKETQAH